MIKLQTRQRVILPFGAQQLPVVITPPGPKELERLGRLMADLSKTAPDLNELQVAAAAVLESTDLNVMLVDDLEIDGKVYSKSSAVWKKQLFKVPLAQTAFAHLGVKLVSGDIEVGRDSVIDSENRKTPSEVLSDFDDGSAPFIRAATYAEPSHVITGVAAEG